MSVNKAIRAKQVRVIDESGQQAGIKSRDEALALAQSRGLDLVEVAPQASPPVCRLLDFGKFKYQLEKKKKKNRKKQGSDALKEVRLSYQIGDHDLQVKLRKVEQFLKEGHRVKLSMRFRGRENIYRAEGRRIFERVLGQLGDIGRPESAPATNNRRLEQYIIPK